MPTQIQRLLTFLLGPLMVAGLAAVSLAVAVWSPLSMFPEIQHACLVTHVPEADCVAGAHAAGISMVAAFVLVIIVALWAVHRRREVAGPALAVPPLATISFLVFCFALIAAHLLDRELLPAYASRIDELDHFSNYISLENLLWPLLIQLLLLERDWRLRTAVFGASLLIVTLTPYRSVDLAIFSFGVLLPFAYLLWNAHRAAWPRDALRAVVINSILVVFIGGAISWHGWVDTRIRTLESASITASGVPVQLGTIGRFRQRLIYPFYQAAIVSDLAKTTTLPTILDEVSRKFRLSHRLNLDEFVYNMIYPGGAGLGEATTLYYGEGAAYFGRVGIIWALGAPLLFVLAWLALSRMRLEASAVLSIALWRSSFSGLITMLPAFVLQLAALFVMTRFTKLAKLGWLRAPVVSRFAIGLLLIVVSATAATQAWVTVAGPQRGTLAKVTFAAKGGCTFDLKAVESLPGRVDDAGLVPGRAIRSSLVAFTPAQVDLVLPYGGLVGQRLAELISAASSVAKCEAAIRSSPVQIIGVRKVSGPGNIPLNLLALVATLIAAFSLGAMLLGVSFFPTLGTADWPGSAKLSQAVKPMRPKNRTL